MITSMSGSASIWARIKTRMLSWQHQSMRYEYPEAHRTSGGSGNGSSSSSRQANSTTTTTSQTNSNQTASRGVLDSEAELLLNQHLYDHPLHRSHYREPLEMTVRILFWTGVHCAAIYIFHYHVKPFFQRYLEHMNDDSDDEDGDGNDQIDKSLPKWKRKLIKKWTKNKTRLCCCCDHHVSSKDKYCPICGAPTCPLCHYCGAGIQNNVNFCNSCGRPVANQVVWDGGAAGGDNTNNNHGAPNRRRSSGSIQTSHSKQQSQLTQHVPPQHRNSFPSSPQQNLNSQYPAASFPQHAVLPPPYMEGQQQPLPPSTEAASIPSKEDTVETVPMVQADDYVPMVHAVYVEEITAATTPATTTTLATSALTNNTLTTATPQALPVLPSVSQQDTQPGEQLQQQQQQGQEHEDDNSGSTPATSNHEMNNNGFGGNGMNHSNGMSKEGDKNEP